jgi:hypothetical protein
MATIAYIASELQTARESIVADLKELAVKVGITLPEQEFARDRAVQQMLELKWVAASLKLINKPNGEPIELASPDSDEEPTDDGKWYGHNVADLVKLDRDQLIALPRINEARADAFLAKHPPAK